ncbi:MAG: hypothetical protein ACYCQJ_13880 [Nitrososphaerales archaeon]
MFSLQGHQVFYKDHLLYELPDINPYVIKVKNQRAVVYCNVGDLFTRFDSKDPILQCYLFDPQGLLKTFTRVGYRSPPIVEFFRNYLIIYIIIVEPKQKLIYQDAEHDIEDSDDDDEDEDAEHDEYAVLGFHDLQGNLIHRFNYRFEMVNGFNVVDDHHFLVQHWVWQPIFGTTLYDFEKFENDPTYRGTSIYSGSDLTMQVTNLSSE